MLTLDDNLFTNYDRMVPQDDRLLRNTDHLLTKDDHPFTNYDRLLELFRRRPILPLLPDITALLRVE